MDDLRRKVNITKEEFCAATRTSADCWIFENNGENVRFWKRLSDVIDPIYYFDNGNGTLRSFKDMPQYGEIWMRQMNTNDGTANWTTWNTWTVY